jgi:hypothetical protein
VKYLPGILAALKSEGWHVSMEIWNHDELVAEMKKSLIDEHNRSQAPMNKKDRVPLDVSEDMLPEISSIKKYIKRISLTPKSAIDMYSRLHAFSSSDFTSSKGEWGGNIGSRYFLDANRNLVDASHTIELGNETKEAWFGLDQATVKAIPGVDCLDHVDVSDGFKGRPEAFNLSFKDARLFYCSKHRTDAVSIRPASKGGGAEGKLWYLKALYAPTLSKLRQIKEGMPPATAAHLGKIIDEGQYIAAATGDNRGRTTSSYTESGNRSILPARHLHPTAAVLWMISKMQKRIDMNRAAAFACASDLPPRIMADLKKPKEQAAGIVVGDIRFTNEEKTKGLVPLLGQPHLRAKVDITMTHLASIRSCDRGCSVITGLPCCHQIALAEAGGHNIIDFMHEADTTVGWRKQYEGIDIVIPSAAEFENHSLLWDDTLALVPPYKRKRGRPNTKRKAGFLETRKKKASKTKEV